MKFFNLCVILILFGCGGGSGNNDPPPVEPQYFGGVHYGYFYTGLQLEDVVDHVDISFEPNTTDLHILLPNLRLAHANGIKVILYVGEQLYDHGVCRNDDTSLIYLLDNLKTYGYLNDIIGFYPIDEPDLSSNAESIVRCNGILRDTASKYPELTRSVITVIYSDHGTPGIETYDWIGSDGGDYGRGIQTNMELSTTQRLILIPGGANPWRVPSTTTKQFAVTNSQVALVLPFLWVTPGGKDVGLGISQNGLANEYCHLGAFLTMKQDQCDVKHPK